jgi:N-acetylglutamate synthase-like GNAT family acetyltransferase
MDTDNSKTTTVIPVKKEVDFARLKQLILEFAASIDFDLYYQNFLHELSNVSELYSSPNGIAYIVNQNNNTIGCICLQIVSPGVIKVKRLYTRTDFKRAFFGKKLLKAAIGWANQKGIKKITLDPADTLSWVSKLCLDEGFVELSRRDESTADNQKIFEMRLVPKTMFSLQAAPYYHVNNPISVTQAI